MGHRLGMLFRRRLPWLLVLTVALKLVRVQEWP